MQELCEVWCAYRSMCYFIVEKGYHASQRKGTSSGVFVLLKLSTTCPCLYSIIVLHTGACHSLRITSTQQVLGTQWAASMPEGSLWGAGKVMMEGPVRWPEECVGP